MKAGFIQLTMFDEKYGKDQKENLLSTAVYFDAKEVAFLQEAKKGGTHILLKNPVHRESTFTMMVSETPAQILKLIEQVLTN